MALHVEIITPIKVTYRDEADEIIIPTVQGEIAVLPHHISLLTQIAPGELTIKKSGKETHIAITGGFVEIANNTVSILAEYAVESEEISQAAAQQAKERAEKMLEEKLSGRDFALAEGELRKALLELKVAQKRKPRHNP